MIEDFSFAKGGSTEMGLTERTKKLAEQAQQKFAENKIAFRNVIMAEARFNGYRRRRHIKALASEPKAPKEPTYGPRRRRSND